MKKNWYRELLKCASSGILAAYGVIGTVATLLTISGDITLPTRVLAISGLFVVAVVISFITSVVNFNKMLNEETHHPVHEFELNPDDDGSVFLYIAYTKDIRTDACVTLYGRIAGKQKRIGYGVVTNVVQDEYIQIQILHVEDKYEELKNRASQNDKTVLKDMYILPRIYIQSIPELAKIVRGDDNGIPEKND